MKPQPGLSKQISRDSLNDVPVSTIWQTFFGVINIDSELGCWNAMDPFCAAGNRQQCIGPGEETPGIH